MLRHLAGEGHESVLALNPEAKFKPHALDLGLAVHEVRMRNDVDLRATARLRRLFREVAPDLIHLACSRSHKLGAHASIGLSGCAPKVTTRRMDYSLPRSRYRRWLYGRAMAAVIVVSRGVRDAVLRIGVEPERVCLIFDGVDADGLALVSEGRVAARAELGLDDATLCGVTTASLHERKGIDVLIQALGTLEAVGDTRLVWICAGEGPERAALQRAAQALPAHVEVRFPGQVPDVRPLLAAADLFALPSRKEGLGVALLEAMAVGLPVVASGVGGIMDAVEPDVSGLLVRPADAGALATAIDRLRQDAQLRQRLGGAASTRVQQRFSVRDMCIQTEQLYRRLSGATI